MLIKRKIQIGVMGSMADKRLQKSLKEMAKSLGRMIAKNGALLLFGFEGDFDSLSAIAARSAEKASGQTIAFVWGSKKQNLDKLKSAQIVTGQERGGGREFSLILSCDAIICISGGSGTLTEIGMAYQVGIPVIVLEKSGGWSEKLAGKFLDYRRRQRVLSAKAPREAVKMALDSIRKRNN